MSHNDHFLPLGFLGFELSSNVSKSFSKNQRNEKTLPLCGMRTKLDYYLSLAC